MVKITVQWQHIKTCKHYSVLSLLPPLVKQKQERREREEQAAKLARELGRDLKSCEKDPAQEHYVHLLNRGNYLPINPEPRTGMNKGERGDAFFRPEYMSWVAQHIHGVYLTHSCIILCTATPQPTWRDRPCPFPYAQARTSICTGKYAQARTSMHLYTLRPIKS